MIFSRAASWEKTKLNLITCALCVVAATRTAIQPAGASARLRMTEDAEGIDEPVMGRSRARSLSNASAALLENLPELLGRLRPFFVMLSLIDLIRKTWEGRVADQDSSSPIVAYHEQLLAEYLTKGNLQKVTEDANLFYKAYNERITKVASVEAFLGVLDLKDKIVSEFTTIEKFVVSHF